MTAQVEVHRAPDRQTAVPRIAIFAHSHPALSRGGGEILAYNSFKSFRERFPGTLFFAAVSRRSHPKLSLFGRDEWLIPYDDGQYLFRVDDFDPFLHNQISSNGAHELLETLIGHGIDTLHFHHFWNVGFDLIRLLQNNLPDAVFVLTLHEFLGLCFRDGQMVKADTGELCRRAHPVDCHVCFPHISKEEFALRFDVIRQGLSRMDIITAPSNFLAERFRSASFASEVVVQENGCPAHRIPEERRSEDVRHRFAFFGQPSPYKGMDVFLEAAFLSLERNGPKFEFSIYGSDEEQFRRSAAGSKLWPRYTKWASAIHFHGRYDATDAVALMQENGWIVVSSIWWENSPLVIQEAFLARRPVIAADIGGMREKVTHAVDGLHFRARNPHSLANVFALCDDQPEIWDRLSAGIKSPPTVEGMNDAFLNLYAKVRHRRDEGTPVPLRVTGT